jgi:hypothetical protein
VNAHEYGELCAACDAVLLEEPLTVERTAIGWLHVLNEHPINLAKYEPLYSAATERSMLRARSAVSQVISLLKRARVSAPETPLPQIDIIFVSHLLNPAHIGGEDFYFGALPEFVRAEGYSTCVVLRNSLPAGSQDLATKWRDMAPRMVLPETTSVRSELKLRIQLGREARRLHRGSPLATVRLREAVRRLASSHALSSATLGALRFYEQMRTLAARVRPKAIVITYEGHAWERLGFAAARAAAPGVRCVGYHHTILFPRQHAALRMLAPRFDPDVILTAGAVSAERFRGALGGSSIRVASLGTHRRQAVSAGIAERPACCLVIPDGIVPEVVRLADFAVSTATRAPQLRFVIRLHPVLPLSQLLNEAPQFRTLPPNVTFSDEAISADFARSRWALYRGSNAAIHAVIDGLRPFYLERRGEMRIDSLNDLQIWKRIVTEPDEFIREAERDLQRTSEDVSDAAAAREYCQRYFEPLNPTSLLESIANG